MRWKMGYGAPPDLFERWGDEEKEKEKEEEEEGGGRKDPRLTMDGVADLMICMR